MSLKGVTAYWKGWVSKAKKGDPFAFLSADDDDEEEGRDNGDDQEGRDNGGDQEGRDNGDDKEGQGNDDGDEGKDNGDGGDGDEDKDGDGAVEGSQNLLHHFSIDDGIPTPLQCNTSDERTLCLQKLVPNRGQINKMYHGLVDKVDNLEVSHISAI